MAANADGLRIEIRNLETNTHQVKLMGALNMESVEQFKLAMAPLTAESKSACFILELSNLEYFDSRGLGALLELARKSGRLVLLKMRPASQHILSMYYIRDWPKNIAIVDDEADALALVSE